MSRALVLAGLLAARTASADDDLSPPEDDITRRDEPTAADVEGAPLPGEESGRIDRPEGDSLLRDVGQGVLSVPRVALVTVTAPVRAGVYMYEHYKFSDKFSKTFFNEAETWGMYPTTNVDTTYGLNLGGRLVHRDLFGDDEKMALRGTTGGEFRTLVDGSLRSGRRLGRNVMLEVRGEYERRPRDPFWGIGNADGMPLVRYLQQVKRGTLNLDVRAADRLLVRTNTMLTDRQYADDPDGPRISDVYGEMITGFSGSQILYNELELRWDGRGIQTRFDRHAMYETGVLVSAFAGRAHQIEGGGRDYWRLGGEVQHFWHLGRGPRTIMTRLHTETVTGGRDDVVFDQLPGLGGRALMRGYQVDRFRDRAAVVGTAEYFWDIGTLFMASLFVDAGRVYPSLADLTTDDLRVGYGASLQLHNDRRFIAALSVASSIDGGLFVNLMFDPVFDYDLRQERR